MSDSEKKASNYEIFKENTRQRFITYDIPPLQDKLGLDGDENYIWLNFLGRPYRVGKKDGFVECRREDGSWEDSAVDDALTIYDVLGDSRPGACLSGRFCPVKSLKGVVQTSRQDVGGGFFRNTEEKLDHRLPAMAAACEAMGGTKETKFRAGADLAYRIPMFDFLPVIFQFWESDDEFPASLTILFDENVLDFMKYETAWYAMGFLLGRMLELMELNPDA